MGPLTDRRSGDDRRSTRRPYDRRGRPKALPEIAITWARRELERGRTQTDVANQLQIDQSNLSRALQDDTHPPVYCCPICTFKCMDPHGHPSCRKEAA